MTSRLAGFLLLLAAPSGGAAPADDEQDLTPDLVEAINSGSAKRVTELLGQGVPATSVSTDGDTPLCAALRAGLSDVAMELLKHGADATACGRDGQPPIALASLRRGPGIMKMLLSAGANPSSVIADPVAETLLESVTDDTLRRRLKRERKITPLMACACRGDVEAIALLIKAGANREARTLPNRLSALDFAAEKGYLFVMRLLLGRNPETEPQVMVTVNLTHQRAVLSIQGEKKFETAVSTGRAGFATPEGHYVVTHKYKVWNSTIYKVPMPYFMRLNSGNFGLHSGYVTGSPASHGCIRLPDAAARKLFDIITVGDEVIVER